MSVTRQLAKSALHALLPRDAFVTRGYGPGVSLTFDDGPHPEHTPRLLDALAEARIPATFFIVGERAERHPQLVRRIVEEGHELGNHTWSHGEPRQTSRRQFLEEITRTDDLMQELSCQTGSLVRPPKGELSIGKLCGLLSMQKTVVLWNRDTKDYQMNSASEMHDWWATYTPNAGDIVLLHDDRPFAAAAVHAIPTTSQLRNVPFTTVSRMIAGSTRRAMAQ